MIKSPIISRAIRLADGHFWLPWGLRFLDDALVGISPTDLVLLGAYTGMGKTQVATHVAFNAAKKGKSVYYFALEAKENEIENRIVWTVLCREWYRKNPHGKTGITMRYRTWLRGDLDDELGELENSAYDLLKADLSFLHTIYREKKFTVDDFIRIFDDIADNSSLIIIDHIHYFDFDDRNELQAVKRALQKIRDASLRNKKPILLLAHLRKGDRKSTSVIPDIDDFFGASDLVKIATDVIIIARDDREGAKLERPTWIYIAKAREAGDAQSYAGLHNYDVKTGQYSEKYTIAKVKRYSDPSPMTTNIPRWATGISFDKSICKKEEIF